MTVARSTYLAWVREGAAAGIEVVDQAVPGPGPPGATLRNRVEVRLTASVNGRAAKSVSAHLIGPGDLIGFDRRQVARTDPPHLWPDYEPNNFPSVEFYLPALPWLFTPARADDGARLRPWICLAVVPRPAAVLTAVPDPLLPAVLRVAAAELPDLDECWAWAHVEVSGMVVPPDTLETVLAGAPERSVSRLLCPRRLQPNTSYLACVVPTFLAGRQAGLGQPVDDDGPLERAWEPDAGQVELPAYFSWEFSTGERGDFELLVGKLKGRRNVPGVGRRALDLGGLGHELAGVSTAPAVLGLEGALRAATADQGGDGSGDPAPGAGQPPGGGEVPPDLRRRLAELLNAAAAARAGAPGGRPPLTPPMYGGLQAGLATVDADDPGWVSDLNLDPRTRVAAGLGARVVQEQQEQFMAAAWAQAGELEALNRLRARGQLASSAGTAVLERHLATLPATTLLQVTAPVHASVSWSSSTVGAFVRSSPLPDAALSVAFRRLTRPRGPLMRRIGVDGQPSYQHLVAHLNARTPPPTPAAPAAVARVGSSAAELLPSLSTLTAPAPAAVPDLPLDELRRALVTELAPRRTVARRMRARALVGSAFRVAGADEDDDLGPLLAPPRFPVPMSLALKRVGGDLLLPGVERIPPNTVLLLETNPRFIEAYMVGLNHELSRELRWRGYPTDLRATYFRHFWDVRGGVEAPGSAEQQALVADIPEIDATGWPVGSALGTHMGARSGQRQLVLVVRGELLRRYPRAAVHAVQAVRAQSATGRAMADETVQGNVKEPLFTGAIDPDILFFGFDLDEQQARRGGDQGEGWFFVFQQPPTETRFGLDEPDMDVPEEKRFGAGQPATADKLSWAHLAASSADYQRLTHASTTARVQGWSFADRAGATWGATSADLAVLTRQPPARVAMHAVTLLPPERQGTGPNGGGPTP